MRTKISVFFQQTVKTGEFENIKLGAGFEKMLNTDDPVNIEHAFDDAWELVEAQVEEATTYRLEKLNDKKMEQRSRTTRSR